MNGNAAVSPHCRNVWQHFLLPRGQDLVSRPRCLTYEHAGYMSRHMTDRTTVRLPPDLLSRAKRKAAAEGRTLTSLIEDGLRLVISDSRRSARIKRVMPPISKAGGGVLPGIDLMDLSALEELDDREAVDRAKRHG